MADLRSAPVAWCVLLALNIADHSTMRRPPVPYAVTPSRTGGSCACAFDSRARRRWEIADSGFPRYPPSRTVTIRPSTMICA